MGKDIRITPGSAKIGFSGSQANTIDLLVETSGSINFSGASGSLFGITDDFSGSLMSVSDISGIPILEVFDDDRVVMGKYSSRAMTITGSRVGIGKNAASPAASLFVTGSTSIPTAVFHGIGASNNLVFAYNSSLGQHKLSWDSSKVYLEADSSSGVSNSGIGFSVDGTNRVFIDANGFMAIAASNTTPGCELDIINTNGPQLRLKNSNTTNASELILDGYRTSDLDVGNILFQNNSSEIAYISAERSSANNSGKLVFGVRSAGTANNAVNILPSGNVGIGTATPDSKLEVRLDETTTQSNIKGNINYSAIAIQGDYTNGSYLGALSWVTADNVPTAPKASIYCYQTNAGSNIYFGTSNNYSAGVTNDAMVIDPTGNVTIAGNLTVSATSGNNTFNSSILIAAGKHLFLDGGSNTYITEGSTDTIDFYAGGTNRFRIDTGVHMFTDDSTLSFVDAGTNALQIKSSAGDELYIGSNNTYQIQLDTSGNLILNAPLRATNGSASAPSITFNSDTNTGMYRVSSDIIEFTTGGTGRFRVENSANIMRINNAYLYGVTSGGATVSLIGVRSDNWFILGHSGYGFVFLNGAGSIDGAGNAYWLKPGTFTGGDGTLNGNGSNLGGSYDLSIGSQSSGKGSRIILNSGHSTGEFVMQARQSSGYSNGNIGFYRRSAVTTFTTLMHIGGDGKIAIGTESPEAIGLHIQKASTDTSINLDDKGHYHLVLQNNDSASANTGRHVGMFMQINSNSAAADASIYTEFEEDGGAKLHFTTTKSGTGQERMVIDHEGRVGIGTVNPGAALTIRGTSNGTAGFAYPSIAGYTGNTQLYALEQHFGNEGRLALYYDGVVKVLFRASGSSYINSGDSSGGSTLNFGIGTSSPSYKLHVNGTAFAKNLTLSGWSSGDALTLNYGNATGTVEAVTFKSNGGVSGNIKNVLVSANSGDLHFNAANRTNQIVAYRDGNVGIGTNVPNVELDIRGQRHSWGTGQAVKRYAADITGLVDGSTAQYYTIGTIDLTGLTYNNGWLEGWVTQGRSFQDNPLYKFKLSFYFSTGTATVRFRVKTIGANNGWLKAYVDDSTQRIIKLVAFNNFCNQPGLAYDIKYYNPAGASFLADADISFITSNSGVSSTSAPSGYSVTTSQFDLDDYSNRETLIGTDGNGKVGIGTNNVRTATKLELWQSVANGSNYDVMAMDANTGNYGGMWIAGEWTNGQQGRIGFYGTGTTSATRGVAIIGNSGTTPHLFVNGSGNVGIGTTSPDTPLDVHGAVTIDGNGGQAQLKLRADDGDSQAIYFTNAASGYEGAITYTNTGTTTEKMDFYVNQGTRMTVLASGNVGIGDTTPSYALDVTGTIRATADVIAYSDERVKDNIETIENPLEKVKELRGVSYNRNDIEDKSKKIGVIAQEVEKVLPEVVEQDDEGKYSVAYGNMVGLLIESVKEQQKQIEELKSEIQELKDGSSK